MAYSHKPELNNASAIKVKIVSAEKREVLRVEMTDINDNKITKALPYGKKVKAKAYTTGMVGERILFKMWEDDAQGGGHSDENKYNLVAQQVGKVGEKGVAVVEFTLKPDFKVIANAHAGKGGEGKTHEYYVTAVATLKSNYEASGNFNVYSPEEIKKAEEDQLKGGQKKHPKIPPKEGKIKNGTHQPHHPAQPNQPTVQHPRTEAPKHNPPAHTPPPAAPAGEKGVKYVYFTNAKNQKTHNSEFGDTIKVHIVSTGIKGHQFELELYEDDYPLSNDILYKGNHTITADDCYVAITLTKAMYEKGTGAELLSQELYAKVKILDIPPYVAGSKVKAEATSYELDVPDNVTKLKVEQPDTPKNDNKHTDGKCPNCEKDITASELKQIFGNADQATLTKVAAIYSKYMKELGMNTCWDKAHFFAQARVESGAGLHVKNGENFNYYWEKLITTFGAFQTTEGKQKAKLWGRAIKDRKDPNCIDVSIENQKKIANYAYSPPAEKARELENTQSNDGWDFRGKGLLQLTGRNAYTYANTYTKKEGADIISNPDLVLTDIKIAVLSSMAFWKWKKIDQLTKGNNSTKKICIKVGKDIDGNHSKKQKVFSESTSIVFKTSQCKLTNTTTTTTTNKKAPWMPYAMGEIGQKAILGDANNPRISEYFNASTNGKGNTESTNWCGAFVSWCFSQAGYTPPPLSCRAAMWQFWKQDSPIYGSAAVIDWDSNQLAKKDGKDGAVGGDGHITFVVGKSADGKYYYCVGGNQGGTKGARTVKISKYSKNDIDWFVIPPNYNPTEDEYNLKIMSSESDVDSASSTRS